MAGDPEVDALIQSIYDAAQMDIETNRQVLDNHLTASDRVIANVAALKTITGTPDVAALVEAAAANPT